MAGGWVRTVHQSSPDYVRRSRRDRTLQSRFPIVDILFLRRYLRSNCADVRNRANKWNVFQTQFFAGEWGPNFLYPSFHAGALAHHMEKYGMVLTTVAKVISQNTLNFQAKFVFYRPKMLESPYPFGVRWQDLIILYRMCKFEVEGSPNFWEIIGQKSRFSMAFCIRRNANGATQRNDETQWNYVEWRNLTI